MKFEQIETLLSDYKNWYHLVEENVFLYNEDIFFKMIVSPSQLQLDDKLPDNIANFLNQLKDKQTSNVMHSMTMEFKYLDQTLRNVSLFKFYGKSTTREDEYQTIHFAKPVYEIPEEAIVDPFCLTLINLKNNPQGLSILERLRGCFR